MNGNLHEFGSQTGVNEFQKVDEFSTSRELQKNRELYNANEFQTVPEKQEDFTPKKGKTKEDNSKLVKYLSTMTVAVTGVVTAGVVPAVINQPAHIVYAEIVAEEVGYDSYGCEISYAETDTLSAKIKTLSGEFADITLTKDGDNYFIFIDDLAPEKEYSLTATNSEGDEVLDHSFTTDAVITFGEEVDGVISYTLNPDAINGTDANFMLMNGNGVDASSNLVREEMESGYISLMGLYQDTYTAVLEIYGIDEEPITYAKTLNIGSLQRPVYDPYVEESGERLVLEYVSGDVLPYEYFSVVYVDENGIERGVNGDFVQQDMYNIYIELHQSGSISSGTYVIRLMGEFVDGDISYYNEIWQGQVIIN